MKHILLFLLLTLHVLAAAGQTSSYRTRFRYILTQDRITALQEGCPSLIVTDALGKTAYQLCTKTTSRFLFFKRHPRFRTLVTNDKGTLLLDPWSITDDKINEPCTPRAKPEDAVTDECLGQTGIINAAIDNDLRIQLPKRTRVGDPTISMWLPYQTWLFGVNAIGLKVRPRVTDDLDSTYTRSVTSGNFNLGLNVGYSFGWTQFTHRSTNSYSITPGFNLGFSGVAIGKEPLKQKLKTDFIPSNLVLSPAFSLIGARNDIGIILTVGKDRMFGKYAGKWLYQNKWFWGLGVSAGLKL